MFNDILTGKASLEPEPEPTTPFREAGVLPPVRHACAACGQPYEAPAGTPPGRCAACHVAMVEANARESANARRAGEDHARRSARSHRILGAILFVVVAVCVKLFWRGMRAQQREDAAQGAGYHSYSEYEHERDAVYPTDDYSYQIRGMADEMCRCTDLACARNVQARYLRFAAAGEPSDDKARASVDRDGTRLAECQAHFEAPEH